MARRGWNGTKCPAGCVPPRRSYAQGYQSYWVRCLWVVVCGHASPLALGCACVHRVLELSRAAGATGSCASFWCKVHCRGCAWDSTSAPAALLVVQAACPCVLGNQNSWVHGRLLRCNSLVSRCPCKELRLQYCALQYSCHDSWHLSALLQMRILRLSASLLYCLYCA